MQYSDDTTAIATLQVYRLLTPYATHVTPTTCSVASEPNEISIHFTFDLEAEAGFGTEPSYRFSYKLFCFGVH